MPIPPKKSTPLEMEVKEVNSIAYPNIKFFIISFSERTYLDSINFKKFSDKLEELLTDNKIYIIIDMEKIFYISSAGLGVLMEGMRNCCKVGGDIKLMKMTEKIRHFFDMLGFARLFQIHNNQEDAINAFEDDMKDANNVDRSVIIDIDDDNL